MGDFLNNLSSDQKGALVGEALKLAPAIISFGAANKAKNKQRGYLNTIKSLENNRQSVTNPYANLSNPYANLSVATKAAEMQAEQSDIALANTLDTLRSTGAAAGGATAIAQAALKSKQGVAASIEKQEVANERLKAQGQFQVDVAKAKGENIRFRNQERRDDIQLDRLQSMSDIEAQRRASAFGTGVSALTSMAGGVANALIKPKSNLPGADPVVTNSLSKSLQEEVDNTSQQGLTDEERRQAISNIKLDDIEVEDDQKPIIEDGMFGQGDSLGIQQKSAQDFANYNFQKLPEGDALGMNIDLAQPPAGFYQDIGNAQTPGVTPQQYQFGQFLKTFPSDPANALFRLRNPNAQIVDSIDDLPGYPRY